MTERLGGLKVGERAVVQEVLSQGAIRRRLLDIGLIKGTVVECVGQSPGKDPCAYLIRSAVIAIRRKDGDDVLVEKGGKVWD